jgi:hypothetical protein
MKTVQGLECGQQCHHLPHQVGRFHVAQLRVLHQLKSSGPAGFCVPGHQEGLQLLEGVLLRPVNVPEAVRDVGTNLYGQSTKDVVELSLRVGNAAYSEFTLKLPKPGVWVVRPEVMDLECHMEDCVLLLSFVFCCHFTVQVCVVHKEVWPRSRV